MGKKSCKPWKGKTKSLITCILVVRKDFLKIFRNINHEGKKGEFNFIKAKNCYLTRNNIDKVNRQMILWEKIFSLSNIIQRIISSIRRELLQKSAKKHIILVGKIGKGHEQAISIRGDLKCYDTYKMLKVISYHKLSIIWVMKFRKWDNA